MDVLRATYKGGRVGAGTRTLTAVEQPDLVSSETAQPRRRSSRRLHRLGSPYGLNYAKVSGEQERGERSVWVDTEKPSVPPVLDRSRDLELRRPDLRSGVTVDRCQHPSRQRKSGRTPNRSGLAPNWISLFVGTWADRVGRARTVLVVANLAQAAAVVTVPVAWAMGVLSMRILYLAALALGFGGTVFHTSYGRFFARIVKRDQYVDANSLLSTTNSVSGIAGPAIGGALIQALTAPVAMLVDAISFVFSAALIRTVREPKLDPDTEPNEPQPSQMEPYLGRFVAGAHSLAGNRYLRASLASSAIMNLVAFVVQALIIVYATRNLNLSAGQIGFAYGLGGFGGLASAALAGSCSRALGVGRTIALGALLSTLPFSALAVASPGLPGLIVISGWKCCPVLGSCSLISTTTRCELQ